jgi:26S proteasome regulatory subunit N11
LDRHYYSLVIDWRKNDLEEQMLMNLHRKDWSSGLFLQKYEEQQKSTEALLQVLLR